MDAFQTSPRRDAWAPIRGFVFQIERTIEAWIELENGCALECEAGEDIDFVQELERNLQTPERVLEQVKHRQRRLTLRTACLLEAMSNFLEHSRRNPKVPLRFRYLTNAIPTREAGVTWPGSGSGVEWWNKIRLAEAPGDLGWSAARKIQDVLRAGAASGNYAALAHFLNDATTDGVRADLIVRFEIATQHASQDELGEAIRGHILAQGLAQDREQAHAVYDRLFTAVIHALQKPGPHRLDRRLLLRVVSRVSAGEPGAGLVARLNHSLFELAARVDALDAKVEALAGRTTDDHLRALIAEALGGANLVAITADSVLDPLPAIPRFGIPRTQLIASIRSTVLSSRWVQIVGGAGVGKSQLARAVAAEWTKGPTVWVNVAGRFADAMDLLMAQLIQVAMDSGYERSELRSPTIPLLVDAIRDVAGGEPLIVLDDIGTADTAQSASRFAALCRQVNASACRVLSTSQRGLPSEARLTLGDAVDEIAAPAFSNDEVRELLAAAGAPADQLTGALPRMVVGLTDGHPALVSTTAQWMANRHWTDEAGTFAELLKGEAVDGLRDEARDRVRRIVASPDARVLLDRLSVLNTPFSLEFVDAAARVDPPLAQARELLFELRGPWIIGDSESLEVSALLRNVGQKYLIPAEYRAVNGAFGDAYLSKGILTPNDAFQVCMHYSAAEAWERLAAFYLHALLAAEDKPKADAFWWAKHFFQCDREWPASVTREQRMAIRALQIRRSSLAGEDWHLYDEDLDTLIAAAGPSREEQLGVAFALLHARVLFQERPPAERARGAIALSRILRAAEVPVTAEFGSPEGLWWIGVGHARSAEDYGGLVETMDSMTAAEFRDVFAHEAADEGGGAILLFDGIREAEAEKNPEARNWGALIDEFDRLEQMSAAAGSHRLDVVLARNRAIVRADHLDDASGALAELRPYEDAASPSDRFVASWTVGRILEASARDEDALAALRRAAKADVPSGWKLFRAEVEQHRMIVAAKLNRFSEAIEACRFAVGIARDAQGSSALVDQLTELGLLYWQAGDQPRALAAFLGALAWLVRARRDRESGTISSSWKLGHTAGWCAMVAATGQPPPRTETGEPYAAPYTGFTLRDFSSLPEPSMGIGPIYYMLGRMSLGIRNLPLARSLFRSAAAEGDDAHVIEVAASARLHRAAVEAWCGDYDEAAQLAIFWAANLPVMRGTAVAPEPSTAKWSALVWQVIWPAFVRLLLDEAVAPTEHLARLRAAVSPHATEKREFSALLDACEAAFSDASADERLAKVRGLGDVDNSLRAAVYVSACLAQGADLDTAARLQAIVLDALEERLDAFVADAFGRWICEYWRVVATDSAFRVGHPRLLKSALDHLEKTTVAGAAKLLLAIEVAVPTHHSSGVRERLSDLARR